MQVSLFTDLTLRTLLALAQLEMSRPGELMIASDLAERFSCSSHHLIKVINYMGRMGWIESFRGKGGGIRLAKLPRDYDLGVVMRELEGNTSMIDCSRAPCPFIPACRLRTELKVAQEKFFSHFDGVTLADMLPDTVSVAWDSRPGMPSQAHPLSFESPDN